MIKKDVSLNAFTKKTRLKIHKHSAEKLEKHQSNEER